MTTTLAHSIASVFLFVCVTGTDCLPAGGPFFTHKACRGAAWVLKQENPQYTYKCERRNGR